MGNDRWFITIVTTIIVITILYHLHPFTNCSYNYYIDIVVITIYYNYIIVIHHLYPLYHIYIHLHPFTNCSYNYYI